MVGRAPEPFIRGVEFSTVESGPCPVCGHPTGDCTPEEHSITFLDDDENMFTVLEDVIERKWITANHLAKVLVAPAGQRISRSEAEKLGLI
jgi:hypothetical protein